MKKLPIQCPSCGGKLAVKRLCCSTCETEVEGDYPLPPLATLPVEDEEFIRRFVRMSGSLKDMAQLMRVSYPTVRNRLDDIIAKLKKAESESEARNE
jgi:hypothetical protein